MATYDYKAITNNGLIVKNRAEEKNRLILINKLKANGLQPISIIQKANRKKITNKKRNISNINNAITKDFTIEDNRRKLTLKDKINQKMGTTDKITDRDIAIFTQNFYLLKKANFNNVHALSTIIESTENLTFVGILEDILAGVEAGDYMYKTMEFYSEVFPYLYINMIKVGELSGSLENSLLQAVEYLDSNAEINRKLKSILLPNLLTFGLLVIMLFVGTLYAIPQIQNVFDEIGTKSTLPKATLMFQAFTNKLLEIWYIPVFLIVAVVIAIIAYIRTPNGKYKFDYFKYKMPIFGSLIFSIDFSRLVKAMVLNLKNGMRIQESIEVAKSIISNYVMLSIIESSIKNIIIGQSWIEPFERSGLASPMITEMLKIGMQTDLTEMMEKLTEYMQLDIDLKLEKTMKTLPQVMYAIVGVVLIFFVVVVLVPMVQVYMGNFLFDAYL